MEWTYPAYTAANYGISLALVLAAIIGVFVTFFTSKKGQEFILERVLGINPIKAHNDYNDQDARQQNGDNQSLDVSTQPQPVNVDQRAILYIGICCCLLGGMTLAITAVLIFQGCFLMSARVMPDDDCPEHKTDCFIFPPNGLAPVSDSVSFVCERFQTAQFPTNISGATATCFAWILRTQSTKTVLDQLGVAIALIGFFTTMVAVIVYLGRCKKAIVLSIIFISSSSGIIIVLLAFKWSFAPLTYAILSLGVGLGIFGLILSYILPKTQKQQSNRSTPTAHMNQPSAIKPNTMPSAPKVATPTHATTPYRSARVAAK